MRKLEDCALCILLQFDDNNKLDHYRFNTDSVWNTKNSVIFVLSNGIYRSLILWNNILYYISNKIQVKWYGVVVYPTICHSLHWILKKKIKKEKGYHDFVSFSCSGNLLKVSYLLALFGWNLLIVSIFINTFWIMGFHLLTKLDGLPSSKQSGAITICFINGIKTYYYTPPKYLWDVFLYNKATSLTHLGRQ